MSKRRWSFFSDLHLRNWRAWGGETVAGVNARARRTLLVLQEMLEQAKKSGCTDVAGLGDIFDQSNPPPQLVAALAQVIVDSGLRVHLLVGNHDMVSEEPGDHALAPLAFVPNCFVYDRPTVVGEVLFCPYRKQRVSDWLPDELAHGAKKGAKILAAHFGLTVPNGVHSTPEYLTSAADAAVATAVGDWMRTAGFTSCFVGNWHNPMQLTHPDDDGDARERLVQCGSACPHGFGDSNGYLWVGAGGWAPRSQPMFTKIPFDQFDLGVRRNTAAHYVRLTNVPRADVDPLRNKLDQAVEDGWIEGYELDIVARGETLVTGVATPVQRDRGKLISDYVDRTFKNEPNEARAAVKAKLKEYGVL